MNSVFKKTAFFMLIFCVFLSAGSSVSKKTEIVINVDGQESRLSYSVSRDVPIFKRIFGFNMKKYAEKLIEEGNAPSEVLNKIFENFGTDIENLITKTRVEATDARVLFSPASKSVFTYFDEKSGREIDSAKLYGEILGKINAKGFTINAVFREIKPAINVSQLMRNTVLRGEFKTYYGYSAAARKSNIERAASFINGTVLSAGEIFSFNKVVGARTTARGYKTATIIENGRFVGGVGGGVCQVSTTIYNAALYADLGILTVNRHSLPVHYVEPSFDAMVSSVSDLRFINDTGNTVYIAASCNGGYLKFSIYGAPREYDIELISELIRVIPADEERIGDSTIAAGEETIISEGADGIESRSYRIRRKQGIIADTALLRRDTYLPQKRVIAIGTKVESQEDTAQRADIN